MTTSTTKKTTRDVTYRFLRVSDGESFELEAHEQITSAVHNQQTGYFDVTIVGTR